MMDASISVSGNAPRLLRDLAEKFPFATALALTRTAQAGQAAVKDHMATAFILRNRFTQNQVRIAAAKKTDLESAVYLTPKADYMVMHETGGVKTPTRAASVAVPTDQTRRNKRGLVPKSAKPRPLRDQRRVFVMDLKNGSRAVARRKGKKRLPVSVLYVLADEAKIAPRLDMQKIVSRIAVTDFGPELEKALLAELKR
ncbi:hypothetical protein GCM10011497_06630 [Elstera cyanobacteriorum]|uniref:Phage virion morphogenesis protein n=1 Tax=Elstera cyanobacteriorum TaxID=2022747 RepID=A0A255XUX8_9PROT|nr:phage tail protein [Elstera cyanobacteriorum]OYQ20225.1 hypothetical protein CHR90_05820 [Elstera cyanobacteriorum]GFZ80797.1 hypothetical protein GCM10011497_06630 [Elstera cyanobacteriorum]